METKIITAATQVRVPTSVLVVVGFDGAIKTAITDNGHPFDFDLEPGECFVRYVLDAETQPLTRPLPEP